MKHADYNSITTIVLLLFIHFKFQSKSSLWRNLQLKLIYVFQILCYLKPTEVELLIELQTGNILPIQTFILYVIFELSAIPKTLSYNLLWLLFQQKNNTKNCFKITMNLMSQCALTQGKLCLMDMISVFSQLKCCKMYFMSS